jgi:hypothetical protein
VIRVLSETFPIMCLQSIGRVTLDDIHHVRPIYDAAYKRGVPLLCISDARLASHDAACRKIYADWSDHCLRTHHGYTKGTVILLDSALLRGALTAMNWVVPPKIPQHIVADALEAIETARQVGENEGIEVPGATWGRIRLWLEQGYTQSRAS